MLASPLGVKPRTVGLEVQRAIHCANGTPGILGSAFSKFIEYTRYWRFDTIYSSRYWKVRYVGIRELPDMIFYSLIRSVHWVALFDMPNLNRFDILSISIFCKIALSISISISIFSKITISISISISIFLELPYRYRYRYRYFSELPYRYR